MKIVGTNIWACFNHFQHNPKKRICFYLQLLTSGKNPNFTFWSSRLKIVWIFTFSSLQVCISHLQGSVGIWDYGEKGQFEETELKADLNTSKDLHRLSVTASQDTASRFFGSKITSELCSARQGWWVFSFFKRAHASQNKSCCWWSINGWF